MSKPSALEPTLGAALRSASSAPCAEPIDPVALAEYLDGVLAPDERSALEQHLAACRQCRELAMEASLAIAESGPAVASEPRRARAEAPRRGWRWGWLAAAAVLVVAAGIFLWLSVQPELGPADRLATLEPAARATLERALAGTLEPLPVFGELLDGGAPGLRSADGAEAPLPLSPRWSVIRDPRPTLRFSMPTLSSAIGEPQACEILVVDRAETEVLAVPCQVAAPATQPVEQSWPADQPALEQGGVYAWKVSWKLDGEWSASEWVPFQVLPRGIAVPRHDDDLAAGAELLDAGLHEEALARWSRLDGGVRRRLLRSVLERQRLPDAWIEREIATLTGAAGS